MNALALDYLIARWGRVDNPRARRFIEKLETHKAAWLARQPKRKPAKKARRAAR